MCVGVKPMKIALRLIHKDLECCVERVKNGTTESAGVSIQGFYGEMTELEWHREDREIY